MTMTTNPTEQFATITDQIKALTAKRAEVARSLRAEGIQADAEIRQTLQKAAEEAQKVVQGLTVSLAAAERHKADLDRRIDAGDDSVTPLEAMEADMGVRSTKGKIKPADAALRKAERALEPFLADDRLALLVVETLESLVDVPVLVRKRAKDVQGIENAVILSQQEPVEGYGTARPSGRVRFTEIGNTGLDLDALENALKGTGADVFVTAGLIDYDVAVWPVTRLIHPSEAAVVEFSDVFGSTFDAVLKRGGKKATDTYAHYKGLWHAVETSLEVPEEGKAKGKVVAVFGVDGERPPLSQMQHFVNTTLEHFHAGVHTSAGVLDKITVVEVVDAGPWQSEEQMYVGTRVATQKFGITLSLEFSYAPVEEA